MTQNIDIANPQLFTVLVNSSDGFEDCWDPFFKLFDKYWPNCNAPIILNTEKKTYSNPNFNLTSSCVNFNIDRKLTWSECLIKALEQVKTPLVLYMQEDYFVERPINFQIIDDFARSMIQSNDIRYIGLTHFGNVGPFYDYKNDIRLKVVSQHSRYRICTQAALWNKETLLSYLRVNENGWMFEIFGTRRAKKRKELFLTANTDIFDQHNRIVFYQHTGIIKGKWLLTMPELFKKEGIDIDFTIRGIYKEKNKLFRKFETLQKLAKNPKQFYFGLIGK